MLEKEIEAFEMSCYKRMMNIKWMDRITNEEVQAFSCHTGCNSEASN